MDGLVAKQLVATGYCFMLSTSNRAVAEVPQLILWSAANFTIHLSGVFPDTPHASTVQYF
jgi:hypothetical protein